MLSPIGSNRGRLLEKYVRVRIIDMTGIDLGLYDYDRHSSIFFFAVSPDERIYLRYGGRDAAAVDSYLDLESLELALEAGLVQHGRWRKGELPKTEKPPSRYPRDIETLRRGEMERGRCVECHQIADYDADEMEAAGRLDKPRDMFRSPDIRAIGIHLDVPRGLVVERSNGSAKTAGMLSGDTIVSVEEIPVLTFGDFLYVYDGVERSSSDLRVTVERGENEARRRVELELDLPPLWWAYDITYRRWSIEPVTYFDSEPLSDAKKREYDLPMNGFACAVKRVSARAKALSLHTLEVGDVVFSVDGVQAAGPIRTCALYIQLHVRAGDSTALGVIRRGSRMETSMTTYRQSYRRTSTSSSSRGSGCPR